MHNARAIRPRICPDWRWAGRRSGNESPAGRAPRWRRPADPATSPDDAYLFVEDADALYAEYAAQGVELTRGLGNMPWHRREFVVKDCDGRLLAFGANL